MTLASGTARPFRDLGVKLGQVPAPPADNDPGRCYACDARVRRDRPFCTTCTERLPYTLRDRVLPLFALSVNDPGSFRQRHRLDAMLEEARRIAARFIR